MFSRSKLLIDNEGEGNLAQRLLTKSADRVKQSSPRMAGMVSTPAFDSPEQFAPKQGMIPKPRTMTPAAANSSSIRSFANPLDTLTQREGYSKARSTFPERPQEKSDLEKLIGELLNQSKSGYSFERGGVEEQMINEIFGSQLAAIASARDSTNSRFQESTENTRNLYGGHVNEIRGADRDRYKEIASGASAATNQVYDTAISGSIENQNKNRSANEEMLTRLGLEASAPLAADAANSQQAHIDGLNEMKTVNQTRNNEYAASDLRRNDARAQSIADESLTKQSDLQRQLQDVLGDLGNKEAEIGSQKAQALFELMQQGKQDWRSDRDYAMSSLAELLEAQGSAESGSSINGPVINNVLKGIGINDPQLQSQYASAYTDAVLNAPYQPGLEDQEQSYLRYLAKQFPTLDKVALQQLVSGNLNYGTYKVGTSTS